MGDVSTEIGVLLDGLVASMTLSSRTLPMDTPRLDRDLKVFGFFAVVFFAFNWSFRICVVKVMLTTFMPKMKAGLLVKFEQSVLEGIFYGGFAIVGVLVVRSQPWVWPSSQWWDGFAQGGFENMRSDLRCFYIMYVARYFQAGVSVLLETWRKDLLAMMIHHIVTVVVICVSYIYGWNRVGAVVMVLLDFADVPLHLAKCCKYVHDYRREGGAGMWQFFADRLFEVFALTFFVTRLLMYGYVCWSAHIEATRYFPKKLPEWTCVICLYILLILQMYWFYLILKVAIRLLNGQGAEDPRSDDEDENTPNGKGKKHK